MDTQNLCDFHIKEIAGVLSTLLLAPDLYSLHHWAMLMRESLWWESNYMVDRWKSKETKHYDGLLFVNKEWVHL